jgi:hypothetical protein
MVQVEVTTDAAEAKLSQLAERRPVWVRRDPDGGQVWDELTETQMGNLIAACRAGERPDVSEVLERTEDRVVFAVTNEGGVPAGTATYTREG